MLSWRSLNGVNASYGTGREHVACERCTQEIFSMLSDCTRTVFEVYEGIVIRVDR